jgi:purine-nucleoside phosphorylase
VVNATSISYADVPHLPRPTVAGHDGVFHLGQIEGVPVAIAAGRVHLYEGYTPAEVTFCVRVFSELGAQIVLATNASGALTDDYAPGDLMVIADHIFLPGLGGAIHPLAGAEWDGRFVPMKGAYDPRLQKELFDAARGNGVPVHRGVYAMVVGPTFETPAEARALRTLGADAVGMSTVPEVVVARSLGMRVAALSAITNLVATESDESAPETNDSTTVESAHSEVLSVSERVAPALAHVVERWVRDAVRTS